jgi:hypothetical protein
MIKKLEILLMLNYFAISVACTPTGSDTKRDCDTSLLPYQYEARTDEKLYFATLIPIKSKGNNQSFFLSETTHPMTDLKPIIGGDPTGWVVDFDQTISGIKSTQLGVSMPSSISTNRISLSDEITSFKAGNVKYSLVSCDGIFSHRFKSDFSHLFD